MEWGVPPRAQTMNSDYDKIEEELKKKAQKKKKQKVSGKSVFKLQEIIKEKSKKDIDRENLKQDSIS